MRDLVAGLARILGFALVASIGCMSVVWAIFMFVATTTGLDVPPLVMSLAMGGVGLASAIGGGCAWAIEVEGVND